MAQIIRQKLNPAALPDFGNVGVVLRIILLVNVAGVVAIWLRGDSAASMQRIAIETLAVLEPLLLMHLGVLYISNSLLQKMPYEYGVVAVLGTSMVLAASTSSVVHVMWGNFAIPWWRIIGGDLLIAGLLLHYFNLRIRALSPALTEARLQALQARIRPHFLYNSLNAVISLIRTEPRRAETALEDMADLFRVLMADNRQLVPLSEEVGLVRQYLNIEQLRLGERLTIDWHTDKMPGDALVPPLVLQPLTENAVYHGIEPAAKGGTVVINIYDSRGEVNIVVRNPYHGGHKHQSGNRMAVNNIRERLALHFDAEARIQTKVTRDYYQVHITVPYRRAKT